MSRSHATDTARWDSVPTWRFLFCTPSGKAGLKASTQMDELKIKVTLRGDHATRLRGSLPQGLTIRASGDNITAQYVSGLGPTTYADPTDGSALVEVENWDDDADLPDVAPHLVIPWLAAAALVAKHTPDTYKDHMAVARCLAGGLLRGMEGQPVDEDTPAFDPDDIAGLIVSIWTGMEYCPRDVETKAKAVVDETLTTLADPDGKAGGWPKLERLLGNGGKQIVRAAKLWLGVVRETGEASTGKPSVVTNAQDYAIVIAETLGHLAATNEPPSLFQSAGRLHVLRRDEGCAALVPLELDRFRALAAERILFLATRQNKGETITVPVVPPRELLQTILALGEWEGIPVCDVVTETPLVAADGTIQSEAGYSAATRAYLITDEFAFRRVPKEVTHEEALAARDWLFTWPLEGFPFQDTAGRAHALGVMLQHSVTRLIRANMPLLLIDASAPGSGKGLLGEAVAAPSCSRPTILSLPVREEERQKTVVSTLLDRPTHVVWDNVKGAVESATLEALMTAPTYSARVLGHSDNVALPVTGTTWMMTANNATLSPDLATRSIYVRLDPGCERPEERTDFKIRNLPRWLVEHRAEMVERVMTIVAFWVGQDMPLYSGRRRHRLERWCAVVGGLLESIGLGDEFLANTDALRDSADTETGAWTEFVSAWAERFGVEAVKVTDLMPLAFGRVIDQMKGTRDEGPLELFVGAPNDSQRKVKLGLWLSQRNGRVYASHKIVVRRDPKRGNSIRLEALGGTGPSRTVAEQIADIKPINEALTSPEKTEDKARVFSSFLKEDASTIMPARTPDFWEPLP